MQIAQSPYVYSIQRKRVGVSGWGWGGGWVALGRGGRRGGRGLNLEELLQSTYVSSLLGGMGEGGGSLLSSSLGGGREGN